MKPAAVGTGVPTAVFDNLNSVSGNDLKVILRDIAHGGVDTRKLQQELSLSANAVHSALLRWADFGLIKLIDDGTVEKGVKLTSEDILAFSQSHGEINVLLNHLQNIFGAPLNEKNTVRFASLYIEEGIPVEVILLLATYFGPSRKSPAYAAKVIESTYRKEKLETLEAAEAYVRLMEERGKLINTVSEIFALDREKLTTSEKTIISSWKETLNMSTDMIRAAKSAAGAQANIRYCNGILKSWSAKGYKKVSDIDEYTDNAGVRKVDRDFEEAKKVIDNRRMTAMDRLAAKKNEIYSALPALSGIEDEITDLNVERVMRRLKHDQNGIDDIDSLINEKNRQINSLLASKGYTANDLVIHFTCPDCSDTGYVNGKACHCLKDEVKRIRDARARKAL